MSSRKLKVSAKLETLCLESNHCAIQKMIETYLDLDKIWELKWAFNRKCSECCLELMKVLDFDEIRLLRFDPKYEWDNIPGDKYRSREIPILHLAIYVELLDVVQYIVGTAPEELKVVYQNPGYFSVLKFVFTKIDNEELRNFFAKDEILKQCVPITFNGEDYFDLATAIEHEEKYPSSVVEKLLDLVMECENKNDGRAELEYIIADSLEGPNMKLKYVDMVLQKNKFLLDEVWTDGRSFFEVLMDTDDIDFIEEMYEKYKPNLLIILRDGGTVLHKCLELKDDLTDFNYLAKKLLEWEPKLAHIPNEYEGKTPLLMICQYVISEDVGPLLIEKYFVDVNMLDNTGISALYYSTKSMNLNTMILLLKNHARMDNLTMIDEFPMFYSNYFIRDVIQEKADNVIQGSLSPDIFNSMILCLVKVHGPRIQNFQLKQNHILNGKILQATPIKDYLDRFQKVYSTLCHYQIFDFNSLLRKYVKSQIETNKDFKDSFIKIQLQMSLATVEIHFNKFIKSPHLYYEEDGFQRVKEFLSIENFNRICMGREMPSLKHLCRSVIRKEVFKNVAAENRVYPLELFKKLEIPICLMKYLCFLDNIRTSING